MEQYALSAWADIVIAACSPLGMCALALLIVGYCTIKLFRGLEEPGPRMSVLAVLLVFSAALLFGASEMVLFPSASGEREAALASSPPKADTPAKQPPRSPKDA